MITFILNFVFKREYRVEHIKSELNIRGPLGANPKPTKEGGFGFARASAS
jgi:hypothetical protein